MTVYINRKVSTKQRYYSNPLKPIAPIWKIQLMFYSFKNTKRVSQKGRYKPIQMRFKNAGVIRYKKNPVTWILESKNDIKVWGKFNY